MLHAFSDVNSAHGVSLRAPFSYSSKLIISEESLAIAIVNYANLFKAISEKTEDSGGGQACHQL
jgi:hypothetical protein